MAIETVKNNQVIVKRNDYSAIPIHPEVKARMDKWDRIEILLEQDEDRIRDEFCTQLPNESEPTFKSRKDTFVRTFINITQDLVTAPINSVFAQGCKIEYGSKGSLIEVFNENVTRTNEKIDIKKYMKDFVGVALRAYGSVCTIIDKPNILTSNVEQEKEMGMPYVTSIRLQDIKNWQLDSDGNFEWIIYEKTYAEPWINPFHDKLPKTLNLECMYTKTEYLVREVGSTTLHPLSYSHNWGFVPVVIQGSFQSKQSDILGNAAMFQSSNSIINANMNLNVGNWELYKHGGALLLTHTDSRTGTNMDIDNEGNPIKKKYDKDTTMDWDGENIPQYLVKDLQVEEFMKLAVYYFQKSIENERDQKSVIKKGTDGTDLMESGVAKAIDRQALEHNLISLSDDCTKWYTKTTDMVAKILGQIENDSTCEFDTDYDMRPEKQLWEEFKLASESKMMEMSPELIKEQGKNIAAHVVRDQDTLNEINKKIDSWNPDLLKDEIDKMTENNFNNFNNEEK